MIQLTNSIITESCISLGKQ